MNFETVKLREKHPPVDIIHILLASRAEVSYSTEGYTKIAHPRASAGDILFRPRDCVDKYNIYLLSQLGYHSYYY